jgi:hypothetical protein
MIALRLAPLQVAEYHPESAGCGWAIYRDCTPVLNVQDEATAIRTASRWNAREEAQPIASGREWLNWGCSR